MRITIIDPSSTEFNRGSFCYAPYLLYNGLAQQGHTLDLTEAYKSEDFDQLPKQRELYIITLWSYPQIESALLLAHMLPYETGKDNVYFAGYTPLIEHLGLRHIRQHLNFNYDPLRDPIFLKSAMGAYPNFYSHFNHLLLSDCDMHLRCKDMNATVYPLFTSYGCQAGCAFCPSTKNCGQQRAVLPVETVFEMLDKCFEDDIRYIHFTDEDFFFSAARAHSILQHIKNKHFHLIALGSAENVGTYLHQYGVTSLLEAGIEIIEVGLETADVTLAGNMGEGKSVAACRSIARILSKSNIGIFWLVQTFFPGESLTTLAETGKFMREYGYQMNEVVGRLRTNGTKGGLGQFFQPYVGLPIYDSLRWNGVFLTERPIRLLPSYLPDSFLDSRITKFNESLWESAVPWLRLYNVEESAYAMIPSINLKVQTRFCINNLPVHQQMNNAIALAILARMGVIE